MRLILLITCLGISATFLGSCKKSGSNPGVLTGRWELRAELGGQVPQSPGAYLPGNGNILEFTDRNYRTYSVYSGGRTVIDSGQYRITRDTLSPYQTKMDKLTLIRPPAEFSLFFQLYSDSLKIYAGIIAADGTISTYARIE